MSDSGRSRSGWYGEPLRGEQDNTCSQAPQNKGREYFSDADISKYPEDYCLINGKQTYVGWVPSDWQDKVAEKDPTGVSQHEPGEYRGCRGKETVSPWHTDSVAPPEHDPTGVAQHESGAKLDAGKPRVHLCFSGFARALEAVAEVTTFGCSKYTEDGWQEVPDGVRRYLEACQRHYLDVCQGEEWGREIVKIKNEPAVLNVELLHRAQICWNSLASLELWLRENGLQKPPFATRIVSGDKKDVEISRSGPDRCF